VCYKPATNWNGWLYKSRDGIVAGFCQEHKPEGKARTTFGKENLRGIYNKQMGERYKGENKSPEPEELEILSECCTAPIIFHDICSNCGEHI
jgi:hypothetical protein